MRWDTGEREERML